MKVATLHLNNLLEFAQLRGVWLPPGLSRLLPTDINSEASMIAITDFYAVLDWVHPAMKEEAWGIKAGNFLSLKLLDLVYRISLQVTTLEEAFLYLQSYLQTTLPLVTTTTRINPEQITVTVQIDNPEESVNRVILENILTIISREIGMMATQEVLFTLTSPYYDASYPKNWEKAASFSISFAPILLKAALKQRQAENLEILIPEYIKLMEVLKAADNSFANTVKVTMLAMSDPHLPDISTVSEALYLTPRSLQRRLERENSSFRELMLDLKKQICSFLPQHQEYSVTSMAYVLGYAEPAAFIHSFKKWFGDSPERVRRNFRNPVA